MNCDQLQLLSDPYLDSELDATTARQVQRHLALCPGCRAWLHARSAANDRLRARLRRGERTSSLWAAGEEVVRRAGGRSQDRPSPGAPTAQPADWPWRDLLWPNPKAYAVLGMIWALLILTQGRFPAQEPVRAATPPHPTTAATTLLAEQREELNRLLGFGAAEPPDRPEAFAPRSNLSSPHRKTRFS